MKLLPFVIGAAAALLIVSGCGSHTAEQARSDAATTSASDPTTAEQADRYLVIVRPANAASARAAAASADWHGTLSRQQFDSTMKPLTAALAQSNTALLRAHWSGSARADVRSLVHANAAWAADFATAYGAPNGGPVIARDIAASHAAANAVRADLGLPPAKPFDRRGAHL